jgi:myo-inositol 2-dehydrogenase/D-chiro-inositol 1-dehydrogenase
VTGERRLRVGVVGLDHYHVTGWVETIEQFQRDLEIVALFDPDPERGRSLAPEYVDPSLRPSLGEAYRALPFETSLEALIDKHRLDIALVTLPNRDAPAAIERLGRAGIHMLVDKPAAKNASSARRAFSAARSGGSRVVVGLTRRFSPAAQAARGLIASGGLGRFTAAEAIFTASSVEVRGPANPLFSRELSGGGILAWLGVHDLDALLWLAGEPVLEVMAMASTVDKRIDVEDVISVALRFAGGAIATVHNAFALPARGYRPALALRGSSASVELSLDNELVVLTAGPDGSLQEKRTQFDVTDAPGYGSSGKAAVEDLLTAIGEGRDPSVTGEDLVRALELIDAAYESARTGCRIVLKQGG